MDSIIDDLENKKWHNIKKFIENGVIDWNYLIDQTNTVLHFLAYNNQLDLIKSIDQDTIHGIILMPNTEGDNICHIAAKLKNYELLSYTLEIEPDIIYYHNLLKIAPLHYVMAKTDFIESLVAKKNIADHFLNPDYTFLEYYILDGNSQMLDFILKNIQINENSNTAITTVVISSADDLKKIEMIQSLIEAGININSYNNIYQTALILAVKSKYHEIIKFLIENGADINYGGVENMENPLAIAIKNQDIDSVDLLLKAGVDVNIENKFFQNAVHLLFENINNEIDLEHKRILLQKCKNINKQDHNGNSVLNLLLQNQKWKDYKDILVEKKLKIYQNNKNGYCPLDYATDKTQFYETVYESYINQLKLPAKWQDSVDNKISKLIKKGKNISAYSDYIIKKIIHGKSYPEKKAEYPVINFMELPETNISLFSSYSYNYICFVLYLLNKYRNIKIPVILDQQIKNRKLKDIYRDISANYRGNTADAAIFRSILRDYINHSPILVNHIIIWKNSKMYFVSPYLVESVSETLKKYPKTKFILIKITIVSDQNFNHANILIFDPKNKYWERFDPYGKIPFHNSKTLDSFLEKYITENFPGTTYLSPEDTAQGISYQIFSDEKNSENYVENDPNGFCVAWCLWYLEMRIKNYHVHPSDLILRTTEYINISEDKFKDYIRKYGNHLDEMKNKILSQSIPAKYWYSFSIPMIYYKQYLKYIRRSYHELLK